MINSESITASKSEVVLAANGGTNPALDGRSTRVAPLVQDYFCRRWQWSHLWPCNIDPKLPGMCLAIFPTSVPANRVSPASVPVSLGPSTFTFRHDDILPWLIGGIIFQPWRILRYSDNFVCTWLIG